MAFGFRECVRCNQLKHKRLMFKVASWEQVGLFDSRWVTIWICKDCVRELTDG